MQTWPPLMPCCQPSCPSPFSMGGQSSLRPPRPALGACQPDQPLSRPPQRSGTLLPTGHPAHSLRKPKEGMLQTHFAAGDTAVQYVAQSQTGSKRQGRDVSSGHCGPGWAWHRAPTCPLPPRSQDWARRGAQHVQEGSALTVTLPSSSCSTPDPPTPPATAPSVPLVHSTNTDCTPTPLHTAPLPAPPRPQGRRKDALISWNRRSKRERATEGGQRQGPTGVHCCPTLGGLK